MKVEDDPKVKEEELKAIVLKMKQALAAQDTATLKSVIKSIQESQALVNLLVPLLFEADESGKDDMLLSSEESLSLVGCLVSIDTSTYLKPVSRAVKTEATLRASSERPVVISPKFVGVMVSQLNGNDVEVSSNATVALVACCRKLGPGLSTTVMRSITAAMTETWAKMDQDKVTASTVCIRCASAVVDLVSLNDQLMASATSSGATDLLLKMLTYDRDPLLVLSVYDLMERMAATHPMHGNRARWLSSETVLRPLLDKSGAGTSEETAGDADPMLGGPALRVLSAICRLGQRDSTIFGHGDQGGKGGTEALLGFHRALHHFEGSGELDRLALVDAISSFCSASPEALDLVLNDQVTRDSWLNLAVAQPKLKAVILTSVAMVIDPAPERDANSDMVTDANVPTNTSSMRLYSLLGQTNSRDATEVVLALAKSPITESRLSAYTLFRAVAKTSSGAQVLLSHLDFLNFCLERERETTKDGREGKFGIVEAIMSSHVKLLLADDIVQTLNRYLKQGPNYVPPFKPELMTE